MTENELLAAVTFYIAMQEQAKLLRQQDEDSGDFMKFGFKVNNALGLVRAQLEFQLSQTFNWAESNRLMSLRPSDMLEEIHSLLQEK